MLRSAVFAKYPGSLISKSYDQNKFSCFPLMKTARINEKGGLIKVRIWPVHMFRSRTPKKKPLIVKMHFSAQKTTFEHYFRIFKGLKLVF